MTRPIDLFLSRVAKVKNSSKGYTACCPAHSDKTPSLSIGEAENGDLLLHCFAGCQYHDIMAAVGLSAADGFVGSLSPEQAREHRRQSLRIARDLEIEILVLAQANPETAAKEPERIAVAHQRIAELNVELGEAPPQQEAADIFGNLEPPHFPVSLMPTVIGDYARDQAELMGVDPAIICVAAIGGLAGCIDDRLQIQPKRHDPTWKESARLWVGIIGDPSAKKSPGISKALGPVRSIAAEWRKKYDAELAKWESECQALQAENKKATLPPPPQLQRLTASDVTVEKLGDILSKCEPRGIIIDRDELNGWLASIDAYKNGAGGKDKAAWLEAYNGGGLGIDRIGRGSLWVENWSACIIGGIQPDVIHNYAGATNHDGLLQRFMLIHARPAGRGMDRAPNMAAKNAYAAVFEHLAKLEIVPGADVVTLTEAAHQVREEFNEKLHRAVISMPNKHLTAMLGKWEGTFARLLLTFHCVECALWKEHPTSQQVSEGTAQSVADLMWLVLLPHAVKFYDGLDDTENNARSLAALLLAKGWDRFTCKRDLNNNMLAWRKMRDWQRDEMLDRLEAYGWIYPEMGSKLNERGKPSAYMVNSAIHSRYAAQAEAERERRAEVVKIMQELRTG